MNPSLVLLDVSMPTKDGFWVLENLRQANSSITVFALTGHDHKIVKYGSPETVQRLHPKTR